MKKFTILRTGLVQIIFLWLCSLSALAQVPSAMDYQVMATNPKTGQVFVPCPATVNLSLFPGQGPVPCPRKGDVRQ